MPGIFFSIFIIYLSLHQVQLEKTDDVESIEPENNYDFIVFVQEWPVTICKTWIYELNGTECVYPDEKNQWVVHGIWPTAMDWNPHTPSFCKNSTVFDREQIKSLECELEQAWTNIFKGTDPYAFWEHEWMKHGTCCTELESLSSQIKYFRKGIEWRQKYSVVDMLNAAKIFPDDNEQFTVEEFAAAVEAETGKKPMVSCFLLDGLQYVNEMRFCFDKKLNLIDCDPIAHASCEVTKGIFFPANA